MDLATQNIYQSMKRQHKDYLTKLLLRVSLLLCLWTSMTTNSDSQTTSVVLKGFLKDAVTKKPVEFATVTLMTVKDSALVKGSLTDTSGSFSFSNVSAGSYLLVSSSVEYAKTKKQIEVTGNDQIVDLGTIALSQETRLLSEVIVSSQRLAFQPTAEGVTINLNNTLFKTSNNIVDVLRKSPSIQVNDDGALLMRNAVTPKVLINGRDIPMSKDELKNYLNTLKPDEVENIEVITNPSARYDAEYKGVVNIKLKRDKELGLTGNLSSNFQQHKFSSSFNNLNLTYKSPKVAYSARGGYSSVSFFEDATTNQTLVNGDKLYTGLFVPNRNNSLDMTIGVDYYISKKQIIGGQLRTYQNNLNSPYTYDIRQSNASKLIQSITSTSDVKTENDNYSGNIYYEGNFKKGVLAFAASVVNYQNNQNQLIENRIIESTNTSRGIFINNTNIVSSQLDYSPVLKKGKLDVGIKFSYTDIDNDSKYQNLVDSKWIDDKTNSNKFLYSEKNFAGYVSYSNTIKKASYTVGLRTENTLTQGNSITLNTITDRDYIKLLPSLSVNVPINDNNTVSASYSRRLTRPSFGALNPYVYIGGPYNSYRGNQYLIPVTNNAFSLNYYLRKITISANFGVNYDDIQQVPYYDAATQKTTYIFENLASNKYAGIEIGVPVSITKWWNVQNNFKYYQNEYSLVFDLPQYRGTVQTKIDYVNISMDNSFKLPKGYTLSLTGYWETGGGTALFNLKPKGYVNLGLQKTYFKNLNATLNVNDIFYNYVVNATSVRPDIINMENTNRFGSRYFSLQLSYSFGKSTYNAKQVKNSSQEEENRANR
jgi:outer membrane receptor protein involved in Fe transport